MFGCTSDTARETDTSAAGGPSAASADSTRPTGPPPTDTVLVLGLVERDLTGDGQPEILRLTGVGRTTDSLDVTFVIESSGDTLFRRELEPLTRDRAT